MSSVNPLSQSDEDFLNSPTPTTIAETPAPDEDAHNQGDPPEDEDDTEDNPEEQPSEENDPPAEAEAGDDEGEPSDDTPVADDETPGEDPPENSDPDGKPADPAPGSKDDKPSESDDDPVNQSKQPAGDQRVFQVPTSFTANGKTIDLKNEEEALQLMQMGANYTRKMQELAPHRKLLLMLQNNNLTDENRLSFLIDLDQKNPDAIKKLLKDAEIDPLEIDVESDNEYFAGSHAVTNEEVAFRSTIDEITSDPKGSETISTVNRDMDDVSKEVIWKQPEILTAIHEHRQSGVYDTIKAEMDRQITLGKLPANTPFLEAYKQVGDQLVAATASPPAGQQQNDAPSGESGGVAPKTPAAVATRTAAPKSKVANGEKAGAAASTRSTPAATKKSVNPLAMDDADFLDTMKGRV